MTTSTEHNYRHWSGQSTSSSGSEVEPSPPPHVQAGGKATNVLWFILVLIVAAAIATGVYFFFFRSSSSIGNNLSPAVDASGPTPSTATIGEPISTAGLSSSDKPLASPSADPLNSSISTSENSAASATTDGDDVDASSSGSPSSSSGAYDLSSLKDQGITAFLGNNSGGIASWYRTDAKQDSTNGRSWCEFPYDDTVPGFAPSVGTMRNNFGGDDAKAKAAFCGLWTVVYSPKTGKEVKMIIADGFDDAWIKAENSIDVIKGTFPELFGQETDDKNDVVMDIWWTLTGERDEKFTYKGVGVG
ncbi:hypothetical protein JCM11251_003133 [Rhodosporidiobolus azoricus]